MKEFKVRLPDDLYDQLKQVADKQSRSIADVLREAAMRYLGIMASIESDSDIKDVKVIKKWRLYYKTSCALCGEEIPPRTTVVREIIELEDGRKINNYYHRDCYDYANDATIAKLYVKRRQLERIVKALKRQADELADVINEAEARKKVLDVAARIESISQEMEKRHLEVLGMLKRWLTTVGSRNEELKRILELLERNHEEMQSWMNEARTRLEEIAAAMSLKIQVPRRRKKATAYEEWR